MNEENWCKAIAIIVVLLFIGFVVYLIVCKPDVSSDGATVDTRSTTQKQCDAAGGIYTTGFFAEGCTFAPEAASNAN